MRKVIRVFDPETGEVYECEVVEERRLLKSMKKVGRAGAQRGS